LGGFSTQSNLVTWRSLPSPHWKSIGFQEAFCAWQGLPENSWDGNISLFSAHDTIMQNTPTWLEAPVELTWLTCVSFQLSCACGATLNDVLIESAREDTRINMAYRRHTTIRL